MDKKIHTEYKKPQPSIYTNYKQADKEKQELREKVEENNMGNISKEQCLTFFRAVKDELALDIGFEFTPATPSICLGDKILLSDNDINYPWFTKQMILHEITHHLVPEDKTHGTRFHQKYAQLVGRFLAKSLIEPVKEECAYCHRKADGAMLTAGTYMAHSDCVIRKLNELLDPDYDGKGDPSEVVAYRQSPVKVRRLPDEKIMEFCDTYYIHFYTPYIQDLLQRQIDLIKELNKDKKFIEC